MLDGMRRTSGWRRKSPHPLNLFPLGHRRDFRACRRRVRKRAFPARGCIAPKRSRPHPIAVQPACRADPPEAAGKQRSHPRDDSSAESGEVTCPTPRPPIPAKSHYRCSMYALAGSRQLARQPRMPALGPARHAPAELSVHDSQASGRLGRGVVRPALCGKRHKGLAPSPGIRPQQAVGHAWRGDPPDAAGVFRDPRNRQGNHGRQQSDPLRRRHASACTIP